MLFVVYNYNFITKFVLISSVFIFFQIVREPIMSNNLNTDKRIWVLKEYWQSQNSETERRKWLKHLVLQLQKDKPSCTYA